MKINIRNQKPPKTIIDANKFILWGDIRELWDYRELLFFLIWRQVIVRYKQTTVGIIWILMQPLASTLVVTLVFNQFLDVPSSGDIAYPVFAMTGLIHWRYFSAAVTNSGQSLVGNSTLVSKVYFPRLIIPISATLTPLVDFFISLVILLGFMLFFGVMPTWRILFTPALIAIIFLTTLSISLWLAAVNVRYRDVAHIVPFILQIWMYLTPIIYPIEEVSENMRSFYNLNPMVGVIQGARWAFLGADYPNFDALLSGLVGVIFLLIGGIVFFNRAERTFADVI